MNSCLTCKYLDEPDKPHKYHRCLWLPAHFLPAVVSATATSVNIYKEPKVCSTWEKREAKCVQGFDQKVNK